MNTKLVPAELLDPVVAYFNPHRVIAFGSVARRALLDIAKRIHDDGIPPMSDDDVVAEVKTVGTERRARQSAASRLPKSEPGSDAGHS
jgi:hypothetical protein